MTHSGPLPRCRSCFFASSTFETLETRRLLSAVTVNTSQTVRAVDPKLLGVNLATWDGQLSTTSTKTAVQNAGLKAFRIPGGGTADYWHWDAADGGVGGSQSIVALARFITGQNAAATSVSTIDYGSASPAEGAALLAYLNGVPSQTLNNLSLDIAGGGQTITTPKYSVTSLSSSNRTATATLASTSDLATGESVTISGASVAGYNITATITVTSGTTFTYRVASGIATTTTGTIVATGTKWVAGGVVESSLGQTSPSWQTAGFWASLRTQAQVSGNPDGLNFLRISQAAPFNLHYWEVGNEQYGTFSFDGHGQPTDTMPLPAGATHKIHDPANYIAFAKQFSTWAAVIDPTISIGVGVQSTDSTSNNGNNFNNWIPNIFTQSVSQGFTPGFVSDHYYPQSGSQSDTKILGVATTHDGSLNTYDWADRATKYRTILNNVFGTSVASKIELLGTEVNSDTTNLKQTTSLVNAIFLADSAGAVSQTEYNGLWVWDLHNNLSTQTDSTVYGWRSGGDFGLLGTTGSPQGLPVSGVNVQYPTYFAEQLISKFAQAGGTVVQASSNDATLDVFAVKEANGHVELLVVNKSESGLRTADGLSDDPAQTPAINTAAFTLNGFTPQASATMWQYGSAEDNVQKNSTNGVTSITQTSPTLALSGSTFSLGFPSLSISVLDLVPAAVAPVLVSTAYAFANNTVSFTFSQPLAASTVAIGDLTLTNLGGGATPAVTSASLSANSLTATFTLATPADANYIATLPAGAVSSSSLVATTSASSVSFFSLAGDANHDRHVDAADQAILTAHLGQSGDFSTGDFDGNGVVDGSDQTILTNNLNVWLPAQGAVALPTTASADTLSLKLESGSGYYDLSSSGSLIDRIVATAATSLSFAGGSGNDTFTLDYSNGRPYPLGGITLDGGADTDTLNILGTPNVADTASFSTAGITINGNAAIAPLNFERTTFDGQGGWDSVSATGIPLAIPVTQHLQSLNISNGADITLDAGAAITLVTRSLSLDPASTLDLNDAALILSYTGNSPLSAVQGLVNSARAGGAWTGAGLTSSAAKNNVKQNTTLGILEATDYRSIYGQSATFAGQTIDDTALLIKYTYYGDTDFNGKIDANDYGRIDSGYQNQSTAGFIADWFTGDFNYDGKIDANDYALIDGSYQTQVAGTIPPAVPPVSSRSGSPRGGLVGGGFGKNQF